MKPLDKEQLEWVRNKVAALLFTCADNFSIEECIRSANRSFPLPQPEVVPMERVQPLIDYVKTMVHYGDEVGIQALKQWGESN